MTKNKSDISENEIKNDKFSWKQLDEKWQDKLMSCNFMIKDCIGDGNCQFRSIETALKNSGIKIDHTRLRSLIAKHIRHIPDEEFLLIIQNYIIEKENGEFIGKWNPEIIKNKREFIYQIKQPGFHFEGDNVTLSILSKVLKIDFLIFNNDFNIIDISNPDIFNEKLIILYYLRNSNYGHYMTIGLKNKRDKIISLFKRSKLPNVLSILLNKQTFLLEHIKRIFEKFNSINKKPTLNNIIAELENAIQFKLSKSDKQKVIKILRIWMDEGLKLKF